MINAARTIADRALDRLLRAGSAQAGDCRDGGTKECIDGVVWICCWQRPGKICWETTATCTVW